MAEFASNLNQVYKSTARPSIFDLLAQDSLKSSLPPAFEFLVKTLANSYPQYLGSVFKYSDELFYSLLAIVERHFLWKYDASFSEHFYCLRRVHSKRGRADSLSNPHKIASLICLVLLPYIKWKIAKLYHRIKEKLVSGQCREEFLHFIERYLYKIFPYIDGLLETSKLVFTICYIINLANYHSFAYACLNIRLTYATKETGIQAVADGKAAYPNSFANSVVFIYQKLAAGFSFAIEQALPASVFFLKFLEWWYSSENSSQHSMNVLPTPPPPKELELESQEKLLSDPSQCPLCHNVLKNPTTLTKSGFVFCYACIYRYVEEKKCCPVTKIECELDHLVRIYF